jgi:ribosomal protein S18 acetylase RimI-like enzyme
MHYRFDPLRPDQAELLQPVAHDTFLQTFGHNYPPEDLAAYVNTRLTVPALAAELSDPTATFYGVFMDDAMAGYMKWLSPCRRYLSEETAYQHPLLLERFYFLPDYQGVGLAPVALQFVLSQAKYQHQADFVYLSVWENNIRAQRFYQNFGFRPFGTTTYPVGTVIDREYLYGRKP